MDHLCILSFHLTGAQIKNVPLAVTDTALQYKTFEPLLAKQASELVLVDGEEERHPGVQPYFPHVGLFCVSLFQVLDDALSNLH